jgi:molecular chaperone DnaK (HSP70)
LHQTSVLRTAHITDTKTAQLIVIIAIGLLYAFQKDTVFMHTIGLDFGTSNTVAMTASMSGSAEAVTFLGDREEVTSLPSVLSFLDKGAAKAPHPEVGPWAIRQFLESFGDVRFIQSLKNLCGQRGL